MEDIKWGDSQFLHIVNKVLDRLVDDLSVLVGDAEVIVVRKTCKAEFSFSLFLVAVDISSRSCVHKGNKDKATVCADRQSSRMEEA